MPVIEGTPDLKPVIAEYDFAVDGGAIGTITLRSTSGYNVANEVNNNSVIVGGYVEVLTAFTTGTAATMALQIEGAGDLIAATVVSGAPYSTTGKKTLAAPTNFAGASSITTTAVRNIKAVIATGTVTAGKLRVVLWYR